MYGMTKLLAVCTVLSCVVAGCATPAAPGDLITMPGSTARAFSGAFTAEVAEEGSGDSGVLKPCITNGSGEVVFTDSLSHTKRSGVGLVWESNSDALWILSTDYGNYRVAQETAQWVKETGKPMPSEVSQHVSR